MPRKKIAGRKSYLEQQIKAIPIATQAAGWKSNFDAEMALGITYNMWKRYQRGTVVMQPEHLWTRARYNASVRRFATVLFATIWEAMWTAY